MYSTKGISDSERAKRRENNTLTTKINFLAWLIEVTSSLSQSQLHEQCIKGLFSKKTINDDGEDNYDGDGDEDEQSLEKQKLEIMLFDTK